MTEEEAMEEAMEMAQEGTMEEAIEAHKLLVSRSDDSRMASVEAVALSGQIDP